MQDGIILNEEGRTFVGGGKSEEAFEEDNNGRLAYNGKLSIKNKKLGTLGLSFYRGVYNTFALEGEVVADERSVRIYAVDFTIPVLKGVVQGEAVKVMVDVHAR